jgi:hypothetical protein
MDAPGRDSFADGGCGKVTPCRPLFLLVADVLQVMIKADAHVRHPLADTACPMLGKLVFGSIALAWPRWRPSPSVCIRLRSRGETLRCAGANKNINAAYAT